MNPRFGQEFDHQGGGGGQPREPTHHYGPPTKGGGGGGGGGMPGMYSGWITGFANRTPGWRPNEGGGGHGNDHGPVFGKGQGQGINPFNPNRGGPAGPITMPTLSGGGMNAMGQNWTSPGNYNPGGQNPFGMLGPGNQLAGGGDYMDQLDPWQMLFLNKLMGGMY